MTELAEAALRYASAGLPVFRLAPGAKIGLKGSAGSREATSDVEQVAAWWRENPNAGIGLATGSASGVYVIDLDDPSQWGPLNLPPTAWTRTRKGVHLLYRHPGGLQNTAKKLAPGVDTRGEGGHVVLPPSIVEGHQYTWGHRQWPLTDLPEWVANAVRKPAPMPGAPAVSLEDMRAATPNSWGEAVLKGELVKILAAPEGERNDTLNRCAFLVWGAVKGGHLELERAREAMLRAAVGIGLTPHEAKLTMQSAWEGATARTPDIKVAPGATSPKPAVPTAEAVGDEGWLLSLEDVERRPPPRWLIPGLPAEAITVFYGDAESGKTFTALDWCCYLASQGHLILYAAGESVAGIPRRVRAWEKTHGISTRGNLKILDSGAFPNLLDPEKAQTLTRRLASLNPRPSVLVLDTLSNALVGGSDSNDGDVRTAYATLRYIRDELGIASLVHHHTKKPGQGQHGPQKERGSSVIRDDCDFMWQFYQYPDGSRVARNDRTKEFEPLPALTFWLQSVELDELDAETGEPLRSAVVAPSIVGAL